MRERRLTFGEVADLYDRARPSYPAELVDDVIALAGAERALEVGAGTGKATILFAQRGLSVLALEPSAEMAALARRNCAGYPQVRIEQLEFERWEPGAEPFPLLYAGQAWHWVAREARDRHARSALLPRGLLAPFWNRVKWGECALREPLRVAYDRARAELDESDAMDPRKPLDADWPERWKREIDESSGFGEPDARAYPWEHEYTTAEYVALISTHSSQLVRDPSAREALLAAVGETIETHGGRIVIPYQTELCLARAL